MTECRLMNRKLEKQRQKSSLLANIPALRVQWGELIINLQLFLTLQSTAVNSMHRLLQHWKLYILLSVFVFRTIVTTNSYYLPYRITWLLFIMGTDCVLGVAGTEFLIPFRWNAWVKGSNCELKNSDSGWQIRGRQTVVGITTRYGLDGPGIESRWRRDFPHPFRGVAGPIQPPVKWIPRLFPEAKVAGAWAWPLTSIHRRG